VQASAQADLEQYTKGGEEFFTGEAFTNMFMEATKYMQTVCVTDCDLGSKPKGITQGGRACAWEPPPDDPLRKFFLKLKAQPEFKPMMTMFNLDAYSYAECPYRAPLDKASIGFDGCLCVPSPGTTFEEMPGGYCQFKMDDSAQAALGSVAASSLAGLAAMDIEGKATEGLGSWMGQIEEAAGAIWITAVCSFVIGLIFMVLLRFVIAPIVYLSLLFVLALLLLFGWVAYVRSSQCAGTSFFDTGQQIANAGANAASYAVASGNLNFLAAEGMTGKGFDYRGMQTQTISGRDCQAWDCSFDNSCVNSNLFYTSNSTSITESSRLSLTKSYCRNPTQALNDDSVQYEAFTIWCFVDQSDQVWESCSPIGVLQPACADGYEVSDETARTVLEYTSYVFFGLAFVWIIAVWCFFDRIRLAISICKVAAEFIKETPVIIFVPIVLAILSILWSIGWAFSATFLLSQVPDTAIPEGPWATYAEVYGKYDGDDWIAGNCTDTWPEAMVYRDDYSCNADNMCWRCAPARFHVSQNVFIIFFVLLWNNAFMIAFGQMTIAIACAIWFFTPRDEKTSKAKVCPGIWWCIRYHAGTLAFGSFIVAVVQFIRYCLQFIEKQFEAQKNYFAVVLLKVAQCITWCLEKCIQYLNKNAYIQTAIKGTNFCTSAKVAFWLILRNAASFGILAGLGFVVNVLGYFVITIATGFLGYVILREMEPNANPVLPVLIFVAIGYNVGRVYMSVFMLACDTSLQCYLIVEEAGGQGADQNFIPDALAGIMSNKAVADQEKAETF
jgi:hypothetical protein